jgi:hypothetical protein
MHSCERCCAGFCESRTIKTDEYATLETQYTYCFPKNKTDADLKAVHAQLQELCSIDFRFDGSTAEDFKKGLDTMYSSLDKNCQARFDKFSPVTHACGQRLPPGARLVLHSLACSLHTVCCAL